MKEKLIEIRPNEEKLLLQPIKIYVVKNMSNIIEEYNDFLLIAVKETLRLPFYEIMNYYEFDGYDSTIPIIVYVDREQAEAWENTPKEIKDRLIMSINARFQELVFSNIYINEKFFHEE